MSENTTNAHTGYTQCLVLVGAACVVGAVAVGLHVNPTNAFNTAVKWGGSAFLVANTVALISAASCSYFSGRKTSSSPSQGQTPSNAPRP